MDNGWLRVDAYLTRAGVFVYRNMDGTERRELRLHAEVFREDALRSFGLVPVTNDHPPGLLDATNTAQYAVGSVGEAVRRDGDMVRAQMLITDAKAVAALEAGKSAVSCGYECELEMTPGTHNGERYDAIQRNIRGNHVALVSTARAGAEARVHMDSALPGDAVMLTSISTQESKTMKMIRIDGVDYEVSEQALQAFQKAQADASARFDVAKKDNADLVAKLESASAKLDSANEKLAKTEQALKLAEDPAKLSAAINARVALVSEARKHLGNEAKLDGLSDKDIKAAVVEKLIGKSVAAKSETYISERYDEAVEDAAKRNPALENVRRAVDAPVARADEDKDPEKAARARMITNLRGAWNADAK